MSAKANSGHHRDGAFSRSSDCIERLVCPFDVAGLPALIASPVSLLLEWNVSSWKWILSRKKGPALGP